MHIYNGVWTSFLYTRSKENIRDENLDAKFGDQHNNNESTNIRTKTNKAGRETGIKLDPNTHKEFMDMAGKTFNSRFHRHKHTNIKKTEQFKATQRRPKSNKQQVIYNYTNMELPREVINIIIITIKLCNKKQRKRYYLATC